MLPGPPDTPKTTSRLRLPALIAAVAVGIIVASTLFWAGAPISSDDLWWHLRLGETFSAHGPWVSIDPLLFSAVSPPIPHSWLFDVFISGVDQMFGLPGLRALHALACLGIIILAFRIFRRGGRDRAWALAGTAVFLIIALNRLIRMRPDLFSIAACLSLYLLLLADDEPPSKRRVAASVVVMLIWANSHALFAIGPLLLCVALCVWLVTPIATRTRGFSTLEVRWIKRLGTAIGTGLVVGLLNPRGITQHLSFIRSTEGKVLWSVVDDWTPFDPFKWESLRGAIPFATWVVADLVIGLFIALALYLGLRFLRDPRTTPLESLHAPLMGLSVASLMAISVSARFLWMLFFPILWIHRSLPIAFPAARALAWGGAAVCIGVMVAFPNLRMLEEFAAGRMNWVLEQNLKKGYPIEGVKFLGDLGLEGRIFARYSTSGFVGYWLSPRIQTLVNASMNFPSETFQDYFAVTNEEGVAPGERFTDVLDRHEIDLYFGMGTPNPSTFLYTTPDLEAEPQWLLIHRSLDHSIYLRRKPENLENLLRVTRYYEAEGIAFDPKTGLDIGSLLRDHTQWAIDERMLPTKYLLLAQRGNGNRQALEQLAIIHLLLGDYATAIGFDRQILALAPSAPGAKRRLGYSLLKLGLAEEALVVAKSLSARGGQAIASKMLALSRRKLDFNRIEGLEAAPTPDRDAWRSDLNSLYVITNREYQTIMRSLLVGPPSLPAPRRD